MEKELKTLKDIEKEIYKDKYPMSIMFINTLEIREEAIKWVKYGERQLIELAKAQDRDNLLRIEGSIAAFKRFFNIAKED